MKAIIQDRQCGYLLKNGVFTTLLRAGKHRILPLFGQSLRIVDAIGEVDMQRIPAGVLEQNKDFAALTAKVSVGDHQIALHSINNKITDIIVQGEHWFWNIFEAHSFQLIDVSGTEPALEIPAFLFPLIPSQLYTCINVCEGQLGLLYIDNKLVRQLIPGAYYFWRHAHTVDCQLFDMRVQPMEILGQEILTADKVGIRINFICTYRYTDAVAIAENLKNNKDQIYTYTQLVLRRHIGQYRLDELLEQKEEIAAHVLEKLQEKQGSYYTEFQSAGIKDIILPGDIRDIMNTVLIAEKTAQANVITRREEVASTRSLLNTAKLMEENKTLYRLKEMEYMEKICDRVGSISLNGNSNLIAQLGALIGTAGREP